jgi:hypothetical protein
MMTMVNAVLVEEEGSMLVSFRRASLPTVSASPPEVVEEEGRLCASPPAVLVDLRLASPPAVLVEEEGRLCASPPVVLVDLRRANPPAVLVEE